MVKVLVGKRKGDKFPGFWATFKGEEVSSYTDTRGDKNIVYTLYRCTAYSFEAFRVHIKDESNPENPVYELLPYAPDSAQDGIGGDYSEPWEGRDIEARYPLFLRDLDVFRESDVDPKRKY